jgi:hypothetical protein
MCPVCVTTAVLIVTSVSSKGRGLVVKRIRPKDSPETIFHDTDQRRIRDDENNVRASESCVAS